MYEPAKVCYSVTGSGHNFENKLVARQPNVIETCYLKTSCRKFKKEAMQKKINLRPLPQKMQHAGKKNCLGDAIPHSQVRASVNI